jgi:hypothetical protein
MKKNIEIEIASQKTEPKNKTIIKIKKNDKKNANLPKYAARPVRHRKAKTNLKEKILFEVKTRGKMMKNFPIEPIVIVRREIY